MEKFIRDFYKNKWKSKVYHKNDLIAVQKRALLESDLKRCMGQKEKEMLERLIGLYQKGQEFVLEECFVDGFLLGVRMTLSLFDKK